MSLTTLFQWLALTTLVPHCTASADKLEFSYVDSLDLESQILAKDNLFVLFFDKRDGSTEEVHRDFLKAAAILHNDTIKINVIECNGKLSSRLEDKLRVYKFPKIKFFQLGKLGQSYNGGQKVQHIVAWVKKVLRKTNTETAEIASYDDFLKVFTDDDIKDYVVFFGYRNSEQFANFETVAKTRVVKFYWTSNSLVWKILEFMVENSSFNPNRYPLYDEEVHKSISLYEQRIFQMVKLEEDIKTSIVNKIFYIKKIKFAHEEMYLTDSISISVVPTIKAFIKNRSFTLVENIHSLKQSLDAKASDEDKTYFAFLYNRSSFFAIRDNLKEIIETFSKDFIVTFVELELSNSHIYLEIFKHDQDSLYILEHKRNEQFIRKFKASVNYNLNFLETAKYFARDHSNKTLTEFIKSKAIASVTFNDALFVEAVGSNYESLVYGSYQNVLTIFYRRDDSKVDFLMDLVKKYENLFFHFKFLRINVDDNEVKENFTGKNFPLVKIYQGNGKRKVKSVSFTPDETAFAAFIKDAILSDEL
jgi:hypothetical protein